MNIKNQKIMEKERKITAPEGCEIGKVELVDGVAVITFREKERKLPKSWEEFCEMYQIKQGEYHVMEDATLYPFKLGESFDRHREKDITTLPDLSTAEAILALCQLIQLRNCYNGDWVPEWKNEDEIKHVIQFDAEEIHCDTWIGVSASPLYFKSEWLRDEFLRNFRPLIEKLKPLYGIKKGCFILENSPEVPQELIEKNKVTIEEIHEALREIERRRIEDNKSSIRKLFERIFNEGGEE